MSNDIAEKIVNLKRSRLYARTINLFLLALSLLLISVSAAAQDDDEILNVESNLVVLNVTVTDAKGIYVHDLSQNDFTVYEDGKQQTITTFSVEDTPFAAAILIDTSGSMEGRITLARAAAIRFLDSLRTDDVAAVYRFDSKVELLQDFSSSRDLAPLMYAARARGMTVLHDAVAQAAKDLAKRPEKRKAILVLSDGADTQSRLSQEKALNTALGVGVTIYTVDMASNTDKASLRAAPSLKFYAVKSGGRYVPTPGGQALRDAFIKIAEELTNQYTLGYQTHNQAKDGEWRVISVKAARSDLNLRTRTGYRARRR